MAIYRLLQDLPLGPEETANLVWAYEHALKMHGLVDRNDPVTELVAMKIIEIGRRGVRDPQQISDAAIIELGPN
ncbi:hypothetical protein QRQ56_31190 [Bradyrhizobium sp. U531]|uniref:hypothetical protein n=1 Tax=Bradyrhizobium sp. U531 TaxID=3053458 RepID=UPI003F43D9FA